MAHVVPTSEENESPRQENEQAGDTGPRQRIRSLVLGLLGGIFATLVMTVFRMPISNSLPPTANFLARFLGGDPDEYTLSAFALHVGYGAAGGGVYGLLFDTGDARTRAGLELRDVVRALGYGLVLSLFGSRVILSRVLGMDLEPDEALIFHLGHVVYGLSLGAWVGSNR